MGEQKLKHLQRRRLEQLSLMDQRIFQQGSTWLTTHWNSSKAANQALCDLGLAERFGQTFWSDSGKPQYVGDVRITQAGRDYLAQVPA